MVSSRISKKRAKHVDVPPLQDDAAERKRVLNILAQRRYRERKRQRLEELEAKVKQHDIDSPNHVLETGCTTLADPADSPDVAQLPHLEHGLDETLFDHDFSSDFSSDFSIATTASASSSGGPLSIYTPESSGHTSVQQSSESMDHCDSLTFGSPLLSEDSLDFPDEMYLPVLQLSLLNAGMAIAKQLGVDSIMWDLSATSPFNQSVEFNYDHLPHNLRPTFQQITIQHHPFLDVLPWPAVRDRLILVFSQPEHLRPPTARSPTALLDFVYDLEDTAEGVRITGSNPYAGENWEVGKALFQRWWWAFDKETVHNSNRSRRARGAPVLGGMILGEATED